ncbi:Uncharacterized protein ESCO_001174 [Escovopsis weberi]|uniref:Uncharacterized protein n=1 Tax=Escovopsis weberi TaxID=150374 RepID=A0A0M8MXT4_ESCWE|nr:Uncharacterized protein ESCO_001174 [Escovopsis weberi]
MASYSTDPALYVYTSLTAGSSHIVTATSRLETILRANRIPFKAKDIAVDEKARMLWGRRAGKDPNGRKRQIPGLVQEGLVLGDIVEIEEWNEYRELKQHLKIFYDETTIPDINHKYPEPQLKKRTVKKSAANKDASSSSSSSKPAPPPAPPGPPLPPPSAAPSSSSTTATTTAATTTTTTTTSAAAAAAASASSSSTTERPAKPAPASSARSVADEAAQKAKDLRLKKARDRVAAFKKEDPPRDAAAGTDSPAAAEPSGKDLAKEAQIKEQPARTDMSIDEILNKELGKVALGEAAGGEVVVVNSAPAGGDAGGGRDAVEKHAETTKDAEEPASAKEPENPAISGAEEPQKDEPLDGAKDQDKVESLEKKEQEEEAAAAAAAAPQP